MENIVFKSIYNFTMRLGMDSGKVSLVIMIMLEYLESLIMEKEKLQYLIN